jgi:hypothetical protein
LLSSYSRRDEENIAELRLLEVIAQSPYYL